MPEDLDPRQPVENTAGGAETDSKDNPEGSEETRPAPETAPAAEAAEAPAEAAELPAQAFETPAQAAEVSTGSAEAPAAEVPTQAAETPASAAEAPAPATEAPAQVPEIPVPAAEAPAQAPETPAAAAGEAEKAQAPGQEKPPRPCEREAPRPPEPPALPELEPGTSIAVVCYGKARERAAFTSKIESLEHGELVIVRTRRGTEHGHVTEILPKPRTPEIEGHVLRRPSAQDLAAIKRMDEDELHSEFEFCRAKIAEHGLPMKLVDVERILGGEKLLFYFTANGRVDFRGLVKSLATEYRMRIELKQIGVRDEAKVLGTISHCGRELCCRSFMKAIEQVTMKMAKVQKSTLDPTKISGRCGRLMCCLRFEDCLYTDLKQELPQKGSRIWTARGQVEVFDHQILTQKLLVRTLEGERLLIHLSEVLDGPPPPGEAKPPAPPRPPMRERPPRDGAPGGQRPRSRPGQAAAAPGEKPAPPTPAAHGEKPATRPEPQRPREGRPARRPAPVERPGRESERGRAPESAAPRPEQGETPKPGQAERKDGQAPDQKSRKSRYHRRRRPRGSGGQPGQGGPPPQGGPPGDGGGSNPGRPEPPPQDPG